MCKYGHGDEWNSKDYKCIICGLKKDNKYCWDCFSYARYEDGS